MPRRGGRDRYRSPREAATATDYTAPRAWQPKTEFSARVNGRALLPTDPIACTHGVPWTTCLTCSKPRTAP